MEELLGMNPQHYKDFPIELKKKIWRKVYNYFFTLHMDEYGSKYIEVDTLHLYMVMEMETELKNFEQMEEFEVCKIIKDTIDNIDRIPKY